MHFFYPINRRVKKEKKFQVSKTEIAIFSNMFLSEVSIEFSQCYVFFRNLEWLSVITPICFHLLTESSFMVDEKHALARNSLLM